MHKEIRLDRRSWCPSRAALAEDGRNSSSPRPANLSSVDDPYRAVLFQDIKPYLFGLDHHLNKVYLVQSFLRFLYGNDDVALFTTSDPYLNDNMMRILDIKELDRRCPTEKYQRRMPWFDRYRLRFAELFNNGKLDFVRYFLLRVCSYR